jgi:hypothetical protein
MPNFFKRWRRERGSAPLSHERPGSIGMLNLFQFNRPLTASEAVGPPPWAADPRPPPVAERSSGVSKRLS